MASRRQNYRVIGFKRGLPIHHQEHDFAKRLLHGFKEEDHFDHIDIRAKVTSFPECEALIEFLNQAKEKLSLIPKPKIS